VAKRKITAPNRQYEQAINKN